MAKYHEYIKEAYLLGCRWDFDTQEFISHTGKRRKVRLYGSQRYPSISIKIGRCFTIHKFIGFQLFGERAFGLGVHVRHLDGDSMNLSCSNLVLGTASENEADKSQETRSRVARMARAVQPRRLNAKLTESQVLDIRKEYSDLLIKYPNRGKLPNGTMMDLCRKFGISNVNIYDIVNRRIWNDI